MVFSKDVKLTENIKETIMALRYEENFVLHEVANLKIEKPIFTTYKTFSMRKDSHPETSIAFMSPKNNYRKISFEILDQVKIGGGRYFKRFELNSVLLKYCMYAEKFILKKYDDDNNKHNEEWGISSEVSVEDKKYHNQSGRGNWG